MRGRRALTTGLVMAAALAIALIGGALLARDSVALGMLVLAPSPGLERTQPPADVREAIEIARKGARVRAWVLEPERPARGTVLVLHGIRDHKARLLERARAHVRRGLRAVAVDSRGHGESSGRYLTYGVEEARDLSAIVDALHARALLAPPLAVVGTSYGAATALLHAAIDARVGSVVALAPFASLREVVPAYLRWFLGPLERLVPSAAVDDTIDRAAETAGFDPDQACPRCVAPHIRAPVLLVHSRDDERIPYGHSLLIRRALRVPSELLLVDGVGHVGVGNAPGVTEAIDAFIDRVTPRASAP